MLSSASPSRLGSRTSDSLRASSDRNSSSEDALQLQAWADSQISEINDTARDELESLEAMRDQQHDFYRRKAAEQTDAWERLIVQRKEEAAELREMISNLSAAIASARSKAKEGVSNAQRAAMENTKSLQRQKVAQMKEMEALQLTLETERAQFEADVTQMETATMASRGQRMEQVERLQRGLDNLRSKFREKEAQNEKRFGQHMTVIRSLREELRGLREIEDSKQAELEEMRKTCASASKKLSARKDEAASLKRHLLMIQRDNEELAAEISKKGKSSQ